MKTNDMNCHVSYVIELDRRSSHVQCALCGIKSAALNLSICFLILDCYFILFILHIQIIILCYLNFLSNLISLSQSTHYVFFNCEN